MTFLSSAGSIAEQQPARPAPATGLAERELDAIFPFHFVVGPDLTLQQTGRSLHKVCSDAVPAALFRDVFEPARTDMAITIEGLIGTGRNLVLLRHRRSGTMLRGQFVSAAEARSAVFVGSPWFTDSAQIAKLGLSVGDFAAHDPVFDMLLLLDNQRIANDDLRQLNSRLGERRNNLEQANEKLRESEAEARKLALVAAHTTNAAIIANAQGLTEWVNEGFTQITGYTLEEARGKKPGTLLQCQESDPQVLAKMREHLGRGEGFQAEIINKHRSGRRYWVSIEVRPILDSNGRLQQFIAIESDITSRKMAEQRLEMQYAVAQRLAKFGDMATTLTHILSDICGALGWQYAALWQPTPEDEVLRCTMHWTASGEQLAHFAQTSTAKSYARGESFPGQVWKTLKPLSIGDLQNTQTCQRATDAVNAGLHSVHAFPVRANGEFLGLIEFFGDAPTPIDDTLRRALESANNQLGQLMVRKREEARTQRLSAQLNAIFELNPDGFAAFDHNGVMTYANPALIKLTGFERLRRMTLTEFDAAFESQCDRSVPYQPAATQSIEIVDQIHLERPKRVVLERAVRDIANASGNQHGRVVYLRDVTREKEVEKLKSEFLSTAAHELRTPMASIFGFSELLLSRNYEEATRRELLQTINRQSQLLTRMINELLDLARIEARAGRDFNIVPRPLDPLLRQVLTSVPIGEQAQRLQSPPPDDSINVFADGDKLIQALTNLLSNAFKYSPDGGPVTVRIEHAEIKGEKQIGIAITDQGIGMTPEQCARATERFFRADPSGTIPGTGLGLSLVKEIAEIMGGYLDIRSEFGKGTSVTFWLRAA